MVWRWHVLLITVDLPCLAELANYVVGTVGSYLFALLPVIPEPYRSFCFAYFFGYRYISTILEHTHHYPVLYYCQASTLTTNKNTTPHHTTTTQPQPCPSPPTALLPKAKVNTYPCPSHPTHPPLSKPKHPNQTNQPNKRP